jgi:hypothetical protein
LLRLILISLLLMGCVTSRPVQVEIVHVQDGTYKPHLHVAWLVDSGFNQRSAFPVKCVAAPEGFEITFLTAAHSLPDRDLVAMNPTGEALAGSVKAVHAELDLALLTCVSARPVRPRQLSTFPVQYGEGLYLAAYPTTMGPYLHYGHATVGNYLSAIAYPGSSGGAVARPNGDIVGVMEAVQGTSEGDMYPGLSRYVPIADVVGWVLE